MNKEFFYSSPKIINSIIIIDFEFVVNTFFKSDLFRV